MARKRIGSVEQAASNIAAVIVAIDMLAQARALLLRADAPRAAERARRALSSAKGAHRNAQYRLNDAMRAADKDNPS